MQAERKVAKLVDWLKERVTRAGAEGLVLGLSGGIDSAVVAGLAVRAFPNTSLAVLMPIHSLPQDTSDAQLVADALGIRTATVDLASAFDCLLGLYASLPLDGRLIPEERTRLAQGNLKPRLRMLTLYYVANSLNYLVAGTGNRSELAVGYFTKHGDSGVDLLPLGSSVKEEVREMARVLGIPERVITKAPSAGLWEGQTDEAELGLTYAELDRYLLTGEASDEVKAAIDKRIAGSRHKRELPPIPDF
ncbi:MAG: NAD(+) synthase [Bacillota bacterium]